MHRPAAYLSSRHTLEACPKEVRSRKQMSSPCQHRQRILRPALPCLDGRVEGVEGLGRGGRVCLGPWVGSPLGVSVALRLLLMPPLLLLRPPPPPRAPRLPPAPGRPPLVGRCCCTRLPPPACPHRCCGLPLVAPAAYRPYSRRLPTASCPPPCVAAPAACRCSGPVMPAATCLLLPAASCCCLLQSRTWQRSAGGGKGCGAVGPGNVKAMGKAA